MEKYQALLEVQRHATIRRKDTTPSTTECMSLQKELEMSGEFNNFCPTSTETEITQEPIKTNSRSKPKRSSKKSSSATPTDFSEAETSSSGFSDETSNKATQTDDRSGSFLCSIADGEDCKFSIYDDNSPFESRFRKTPEYRQLFSEIFGVLKRAAEAKDEGEQLPLLDDSSTSHVTSETPIQEDLISEATDDTRSMLSSVVSEPVFSMQSVSTTNARGERQRYDCANKPDEAAKQKSQHGMNYLALNIRKQHSGKKNSNKKIYRNDRPTTSDIIPTTNPKFVMTKSSSGGRRKFKPFNPAEVQTQSGTWNGQYSASSNRSRDKRQHANTRVPNEQQQQKQHNNNSEFKDFKPSTASEDVARLRRLEMSYAEVLRTPSKPRGNNHHRRS